MRLTMLGTGGLAGCLAAMMVLSSGVSRGEDWNRFRGPNGSGVSTDTTPVPTTWSATENLKWKVKLPGPGSSSPIIVGDKVFVTCWSGYGVDRANPGDQQNLRRHLICLNRSNGEIIWDKEIAATLPEDNYGGMFAEHGYASHTPACDGEHVYVFFGKTGALAFDLQGNQLWQTSVGTDSDPRGWGSACSPILYKDLVIITASAESESIVALKKENGEVAWKQEAAGFGSTWGTPVLVKIDDERTDLVLGVPHEIWAFNPDTGKLRWYCPAMETDSFCSSVITEGGIVFGIEGRGGGSIAVRAGGEKDVSKSHVVWTGRQNGRIGTPVLHDGLLYSFNGSAVTCVDAKTGENVYQERLSGGGAPANNAGGGGRGGRGGQDYASPILADGKIYFQSRGGQVYVIKEGREFKQLAVNTVTSEREDFSATPAVSDGDLFIHSSGHLYCIGQK